MSEVILTLNAGSSSVKFALFKAGDSEPELVAKGQVEGIGTAPHFIAKDAEGALLAESYWKPVGGGEGHAVAFRQIWRWLSDALEGKSLVAVGHRVAPSTIARVLKENGIRPAPERPHGSLPEPHSGR